MGRMGQRCNKMRFFEFIEKFGYYLILRLDKMLSANQIERF